MRLSPFSVFGGDIAASAAGPASQIIEVADWFGSDLISIAPGANPHVIHRRGKFKQNARRQKGRKTLPRRAQ